MAETSTALGSRRRLLLWGLGAGVAVSAIGVGTMRGTMAADGLLVLSAEEATVLEAVAMVMFPGTHLALSAREANIIPAADRFVSDLPEAHVAGFRVLLRGLEWGTLVSRGRRFTRLPAAEQREVFEVWSDPVLLPRRIAADAIKMIISTAYFSNPDVLKAIGWRATCGGSVA